MARASSVISVSIIGDAKKLVGAVGDADKATGGLVKSAAKLAVGAVAIGKGFDFIQGSLAESDRLGDAMARLSNQLTPETAKVLERNADSFSRIGASAQDMLELEAIFADFATAAGIADPTIAGMAESVAATAQALTQTDDEGRDATAMMDLLNKAAGGSAKAAKELGVTLTDGLAPADQMRSIISQLNPKLVDATTGTQDLASKQEELGAKFETVMGKIGAGLEGPLTDILTFIDDQIEQIPGAIAGWQMLGDAIVGMAEDVLSPLARVADALRTIIKLFDSSDSRASVVIRGGVAPSGGTGTTRGTTDRAISDAQRRQQERNGLGT